jgi:hypothetical protein
MTRSRPYVVVPTTISKRYKKSTHTYANNAFLEASRIAQESHQKVIVYKREGNILTPYTVVDPQSEIELLLRRKARLEKELARIHQQIADWQKV